MESFYHKSAVGLLSTVPSPCVHCNCKCPYYPLNSKARYWPVHFDPDKSPGQTTNTTFNLNNLPIVRHFLLDLFLYLMYQVVSRGRVKFTKLLAGVDRLTTLLAGVKRFTKLLAGVE